MAYSRKLKLTYIIETFLWMILQKTIDHDIETNEGDESSSSQISKSNQDEAQQVSLQKQNSTKSINDHIETIELVSNERDESRSSQDKIRPRSAQKINCCHII